MTIPRSKRPPRPARSGRPRKLNTPPSAIGGLNVTLDLFKLADLQELANASGLPLVPNSRSLWAVSAINEAFSNYANTTAMQIDDSPAGERRDWCAGIAKASDELRRGLGQRIRSPVSPPPCKKSSITSSRPTTNGLVFMPRCALGRCGIASHNWFAALRLRPLSWAKWWIRRVM